MATKKQKRETSVPDQLRQAMADSGLSNYAIEQATGISRTVLGRFTNGKRGISLETAGKIMKSLGIELRKVGE